MTDGPVITAGREVYRRMSALWPALRAEERAAAYRDVLEREAARLVPADVREGTASLIGAATGQYPPMPAEWIGCILQARQRRLDAAPRPRRADTPGPQMRRVVGQECSRLGCHGPLDLLVAESVLWCGRCRSVQRAAPGEQRVRLGEDDVAMLVFADPVELPDRAGFAGVDQVRDLIARLARQATMPEEPRRDPEDAELSRLVAVQFNGGGR